MRERESPLGSPELDRESFHRNIKRHPIPGSMNHQSPSAPRASVRIAQLDAIPPVACPCGQARRAFKDPENELATVHLTDISRNSRAHYHKRMTEIYIVLEGEGVLEADGETYPLKPMTTVMIPPGCIHRAVGNLRIINVPIPAFDPADEFEVDGPHAS